MRPWVIILLLLLVTTVSHGQYQESGMEGTVTFISTQNIYVKFRSTEDISAGDTLYLRQESNTLPAMIARYLSSTSVACIPIDSINIDQGTKVIWIRKKVNIPKPPPDRTRPVNANIVMKTDSLAKPKPEMPTNKEEIKGYISAASYLFYSSQPGRNSQRMQYTLSLRARNLSDSKLSLESYVTFRHKIHEWSAISDNIFNGLKIYNLNVQYDISRKINVVFGRKLNPKFSNLGAADGLQVNINLKPFTMGFIAGTRPDFYDYGFNRHLFQYGGYIFHELNTKNGMMQNTLAFVDQRNSGKTDRRFAYFQHYNSILPKLSVFGSAEIDLFKKTMMAMDSTGIQDTTYNITGKPRLSSLYFSLRYRFNRKIYLSLSYSARQNIIYYETYKNFIDRLLQYDTRQGYYCQLTYRPVNKLTFGTNLGYNFQKNDPVKSRNINSYLTWSQVPLIKTSATLSVILLETSYLKGKIFRIDLSRDIIPGKIYGGINYSYVKYYYTNSEYNLPQNIGELNISWRIIPKLTLSVYSENTFEKNNRYNRIYILLNNRF